LGIGVRREKIGDRGGEAGIERRGYLLEVGKLSMRRWSWVWRYVLRVFRFLESYRDGVKTVL
jgi:hypothetical protein